MIGGLLRRLQQEQIQIRLNLVVAMAIGQIAFLTGIDASETKVSYLPTGSMITLITMTTTSYSFYFCATNGAP